jgi:hypothetical protein
MTMHHGITEVIKLISLKISHWKIKIFLESGKYGYVITFHTRSRLTQTQSPPATTLTLIYSPINIGFNTQDINNVNCRQTKSRRKRWTGHVACMGEGRNVYRVLVGSPEEKDHLEDQGVDGSMGSKWTLGRLAGGWGVEWIHLFRIGIVGGLS